MTAVVRVYDGRRMMCTTAAIPCVRRAPHIQLFDRKGLLVWRAHFFISSFSWLLINVYLCEVLQFYRDNVATGQSCNIQKIDIL